MCVSRRCSELHDAQTALQRKAQETSDLGNQLAGLRTERERLRDDYERRLQAAAEELHAQRRTLEDSQGHVDQIQTVCQEAADDNNVLRLRLHALQREKEEVFATKQLQQEACASCSGHSLASLC
jgi:chromosome segregation ATPase